MNSTNNLNPIIRYPLGILAGLVTSVVFLFLLLGALKLGELIVSLL